MDVLRFVLLLFVGHLPFWAGSQALCAHSIEDILQGCLTHSISFSMNPEEIIRTEINNLSRSQMKELCKILYGFKDCVKQELKPCTEQEEFDKIMETFDESFDYVCHEGFELLMEIKPCTSSENFKHHMNQCSYEVQDRFNLHKVKLMNDFMLKMKVCQYLEESPACMETVAKRLCGEDAQKYFRELNIRTLGPAKRYLQCTQARNTRLIGLGISIALLLAIVVLMVGRCLRRHQLAQDNSSENLLIPSILHHPFRPRRMGETAAAAAAATTAAAASNATGNLASAEAAAAPPYSPPSAQSSSREPTNTAIDMPNEDPKDLPPQYPGHSSHSGRNAKDEYTTPPPSYEQVMAEMRNPPEEL
ncbi:uncharacterized protein LOC115212335 isoform X1 [Argonauta hians]